MNSLFSETKKINYLGIFYNDKEYDGNVSMLFDPKKFDEIYICTFVSSPKYFFTQVKEYKNIELILGIEDGLNANKFAFDPNFTNEFFKSLPHETIQKIKNNSIKIRYTKQGTAIHSKIYIQRDSKNNNLRIMVGSANYSNRAFANKNQFEELLIYDSDYNSHITNYYWKRYNYIKEQTLDFVPKYLKNKFSQEDLKILTLSDEESLEILKDRIRDISAAVIVPDELSEDIKETKKFIAKQKDEIQKELKSFEETKQIFEIVTKTTKNRTEFIKPAQFIKKKEQIITKILKPKRIVKEFKDSRIYLFYSEQDESIYLKDEKTNNFEKYAKESDKGILAKRLNQLEQFISSYENFTINRQRDTQKRVFEAILYAFLSPYIWKMREKTVWEEGRDEVKTGFPLIMLIAGMSYSGKTHLIKFISHMMGNYGFYYHYVKQSKLSSMNQINPQIINEFFNSKNLTPIFIDEINKEYFSSKNSSTSVYMGEAFIKNLINIKEGQYPCMVATSNTDFSANPQIMRRIYYIQLNNPFDSSKKGETSKYFTSLLNDFGTELYRDFLYRLENKFKDGIKIDVNDILSPAREIFKEYYEMLNMKIPSYFSDKRIDDYYLRGKEMWKDLYKMRYKGFKEDKKANTILIDDEIVFGSKMSANREKREMLQYLPIGILIEDKGIAKLNLEKFFQFIELKSKNKKFLGNFFNF